MELPILLLTPLPESAVKLVTQFLRKPHPCAVLIKQLTFYYKGLVEVDEKDANFLFNDADDYKYCFIYDIRTGEPLHAFPQRAIALRTDYDDDDDASSTDSEHEHLWFW